MSPARPFFSGFYLTLKPMHFTLRPFSFPLSLHTFSEVQFNKFARPSVNQDQKMIPVGTDWEDVWLEEGR